MIYLGVAGLACARTLVEGGAKKVLVLEARNRLGGRTESTVIGNGKFDLGGQWVGPAQTRLLKLIDELKLQKHAQYCDGKKVLDIFNKVTTYSSDIPNGAGLYSILELGLAIHRVDNLSKRVGRVHPEDSKEAEYLDGITTETLKNDFAGAKGTKALLDCTVRGVFGVEPRDLSALHFANYVASNGDLNQLVNIRDANQQWVVHGGMQQVSQGLEGIITASGNGSVSMGIAVRKVDTSRGDGVVEVHAEVLADKEMKVFKTRAVVLALSPPIANTIQYEPPLPYQRSQLLARCVMGCIIKSIILYDSAFWRADGKSGEAISDCESGPCFQTFDDSYEENGVVKQAALVAFINGEPARAWNKQGINERRQAVVAQLVRWFGPKAARFVHYEEKLWGQEEFSRGCPIGIFPPGVLSSAGAVIRQPTPPLFWCGTETAQRSQGFVDGALESGMRAASQTLGFIRKKGVLVESISTTEKSFLVTGGTGFLGQHLVQALLEENETSRIFVLSRSRSSNEIVNSRVCYLTGSVLDLPSLLHVVEEYKIDAIFHLSGAVHHSRSDPGAQARLDELHVVGARNAVLAAAQTSLKRIVLASTSGFVGVQASASDGAALESDDVKVNIIKKWPYYLSKARGEEEFFRMAAESGVHAVAMRPSLILGPGAAKGSPGSTLIVTEFLRRRIPVLPSGGLSLVDVRDVAVSFVNAMKVCCDYFIRLSLIHYHSWLICIYTYSSSVAKTLCIIWAPRT